MAFGSITSFQKYIRYKFARQVHPQCLKNFESLQVLFRVPFYIRGLPFFCTPALLSTFSSTVQHFRAEGKE